MLTEDRPPPLHLVVEVARLAALRSYRVLDAETVLGLDGLVQAAALALGRSMAALSFVDSERLWYGPALGITPGARPRAGSLCHEAIAQPGPMIVGDALLDSRFNEHPDVVGPNRVRFYAGVCLEDEDGYRLGTLCVFDREPGLADADGMSELARLAGLAVGALAAFRDSLLTQRSAQPPSSPHVQGWLGVRTRGAERGQVNSKPGLLVLSVAPDSPAERAGLRPTDVLVAVDGRIMRHPADVVAALAQRPVGSLARLQVLRARQTLERVVPIEPEPDPRSPMATAALDGLYLGDGR